MSEQQYQASKIRPIVQIVAQLVKRNPALADDFNYLWTQVLVSIPDLGDKTKCGGCDRSMKVTVYEADVLDALLILAMAKQVREGIIKGLEFTEANKVHLPTLGTTQGILKRQTKCDYLCLIKQQPQWRGSGYWALTHWAWKALRGEEIPRAAKYWEGNLLGRSEETITLSQMFQNHADLVQKALQKRAEVKADHRAAFSDYKPSDWSEIGAVALTFS